MLFFRRRCCALNPGNWTFVIVTIAPTSMIRRTSDSFDAGVLTEGLVQATGEHLKQLLFGEGITATLIQ